MAGNMNEIVLQALKDARKAFFDGNCEEYEAYMKAAKVGINSIEAMGMPMDGSSGLPLAVLGLRGEYAIQSALPLLQNPKEAAVKYEIAAVSLLSVFQSRVVDKEDPWLPNPADLFSYFGREGAAAEALADDLERAQTLYGKLTGGGGGVSALYRAELCRRKGNWKEAAALAERAKADMTGDRWMKPLIKDLTDRKGRNME